MPNLISNSRTRLYLILIAAGTALAACGGAGSSMSEASAPEVINGITVPPEPDSTINAKTLAGVDSNSNGVRDDVERKLALAVKSNADYSAAIAYAKDYQSLITNALPANRDAALLAYSKVICTLIAASADVKTLNMETFIATTTARSDVLLGFFDVVIGFSPEELTSCPV